MVMIRVLAEELGVEAWEIIATFGLDRNLCELDEVEGTFATYEVRWRELEVLGAEQELKEAKKALRKAQRDVEREQREAAARSRDRAL